MPTDDGLLTNMDLRPLVQRIRHGEPQDASDAMNELFNGYDRALGRVMDMENELDRLQDLLASFPAQ